jgi:hypothetical protein
VKDWDLLDAGDALSPQGSAVAPPPCVMRLQPAAPVGRVTHACMRGAATGADGLRDDVRRSMRAEHFRFELNNRRQRTLAA